ncbi:Flagellar hook-length control protein [Collimonas fungivorans Ter331]|uniref:Flagellar hook-length control protein n=1 Tax=Collimonas fungivorans (strain Ter331) TaxID=1005048 RepID=G0AJ08_COLFT|nr:Flagellar hook-length control protein [Collimonas fungivorans Ter331]
MIGDCNRFLFVVEAVDAQYRTKDFLTPERAVAGHIDEDRRCHKISLGHVWRLRAAGKQLESGGHSLLDVLLHFLMLPAAAQGTHLGCGIHRIANLDRFDALFEARREILGNAAFNQQPRGGRAHLSGVEKYPAADNLQRQFDNGVGKHQRRRFSAQLQADPLEVVSRCFHHRLADCGAAGEGNLAYRRMGNQRRAGLGVAGDQVEDASRQSGLIDDRRQRQLRQWRYLRWLEHDRAAGRECRRHFPCGGHHRKISRPDQGRDAARFMSQRCAKGGAGQGHGLVLMVIKLYRTPARRWQRLQNLCNISRFQGYGLDAHC